MLDSCVISCISVTAENAIMTTGPEKSMEEVWRQLPNAAVLCFLWRAKVMGLFNTCSEPVCWQMCCGCFKCFLGYSFGVMQFTQTKPRTRSKVMASAIIFGDVHMKYRCDPTRPTSACDLRPNGPLAGGDGVLIGSQ